MVYIELKLLKKIIVIRMGCDSPRGSGCGTALGKG